MMNKAFRWIVLLCTFPLSLLAQDRYGNEWIHPGQSYYKIAIAKRGVYRISLQSLTDAGINPTLIQPDQLQLFCQGKESPIYLQGMQDGHFDAEDFIEFYGEPNNGFLDQELFSDPSDPINPGYSFFSDTSYYFLTWGNTIGKRISAYTDQNFNRAELPWFSYRSELSLNQNYYKGEPINEFNSSFSEYTRGEGYVSSSFARTTARVDNVPTPGVQAGAGSAIAEVLALGRSNAKTTHPGLYNHHLAIETGADGANYQALKDTMFKGYEIVRITAPLPLNLLGATNTAFRFTGQDIGAESDFRSIARISVTYPRKFQLSGLSELLFTLPKDVTNPSPYLKFSGSTLGNPLLYDLSTHTRIMATKDGDTVKAVLSSDISLSLPNGRPLYLCDSNTIPTVKLSKVNMDVVNAGNFSYDFLIVTHSSLLASATQYQSYRQQKGYKPYLVTTEQLYNQFGYGQHHPLAIRRFCDYLLTNAGTKPAYLLLLGKGQQTDLVRTPASYQADLVPSIGLPPSDMLFTSGLNGTQWEPALATGRVAAKNDQDVLNYLDKLMAYESAPDSLWRKTLVHISGGNDLDENNLWSSYQQSFARAAEKESFGAHTISYYKNVNQPIVNNLKEKIIANINTGASVLSFFGHGANFATEINFGASDELNNQGKYPVYILNGCLLGNPSTTSSMGELFLFEKNKGAIGWIASTDEGYPAYLGSFSTRFYENSFRNNYGASVAQNISKTIREFQKPNDVLNRIHCRQYLFQGDPALSFYAPAKADYEISDKDLFIYPADANALSDSFAVAVIVKNPGKAIPDSVTISLTRKFADQTEKKYASRTFLPVYHTDTFYFYIREESIARSKGLNIFTVRIDSNNLVPELNELNNSASIGFYMPASGVNILFPKDKTIYDSSQVRLIAQSNDLLVKSAGYYFEIDTGAGFNSPWKKSSGLLSAGFMPQWSPNVSLQPMQTYFWRVRQNLPFREGGDWEEASFTYIPNSDFGYYAGTIAQLNDFSFQNIRIDSASRTFAFTNTSFFTSIQTRGDDAPRTTERTFRSDPGGRRAFHSAEFIGLTFLALNPVDLSFYSLPGAFNFQNSPGEYTGQNFYNINDPVHVDSMVAYLAQIPQDYYVLGFNGRGIHIKALPEAAHQAFESIGCNQSRNVDAGWPYLFFGQKGKAPGTALERTADTLGSTVAPKVQGFKVDREYLQRWIRGEISSGKVGPTTAWKELSYAFDANAHDTIRAELIGTLPDGNDTLLASGFSSPYDLRMVDAQAISSLRVRFELSDEVERDPATLRFLQLSYDDIAEGTINPEIRNEFYKDDIEQGDTLRWKFAYQNISSFPTDSLAVHYVLLKSDRTESRALYRVLPPVAPWDTAYINLELDSRNMLANNKLTVHVEPLKQQDSYAFNNILQREFNVNTDTRKPVVDILFDGKRITNNEIIQPRPTISIRVKDDNKHFLLNDTASVILLLRQPGSSSYEVLSYQSPDLLFMPALSGSDNTAEVTYRPDLHTDGTYSLKVRAKDALGNGRVASDYTIDFEVVNESSITHFYPYPNPFSTSMRFVFTLTGAQIPDQVRIQIMTVTGKIVREINETELGPMKIGNNISAFTWNGTDQFGDRLANGVYFYRVMTRMNNQEIKHRKTSAEQYVEKGFGKIYLIK
jgi:hypothetical protein